MKRLTKHTEYIHWMFLLGLIILSSCKKDIEGGRLTATTLDPDNVTVNSAVLKGITTGEGVRSRGVVYSTVSSPTLEEDDALPVKPGSGEFSVEAFELQGSTRYYFRTYVFSDAGIVYGEEKTFRTLDITLPQITLHDPEDITGNSAFFKATIVSPGSSSVILEKGFVWSSTEQEPTIEDERQIVTEGEPTEIVFDNQSLEVNTIYYFRAYARTQTGIGYSQVKTFQTLLVQVPEVVMAVDPIIKGLGATNTATTLNTITRAGIVYSENNAQPTLSNSSFVDATSPEANFSAEIKGLKPYTLYYIAAYAIDANGTGYSAVQRVRTGTYGSVNGNLVLVQPPAFYTMGWTSLIDGRQDLNLFVNNTIASGNCVAEGIEDFFIAKYPVTNQEYCDFLNEYGHTTSQLNLQNFGQANLFNSTYVKFSKQGDTWIPDAGVADHPAIGINWIGAQEFCVYYGGRLPDEAEWEIAARGGQYTDAQGKTTYTASNTLNDVAWNSGNSGASTQPVGQKDPNAIGLYDMSGNVFEWTESWYQRYQGSWLLQKTMAPGSTYNKTARGGSFKSASPVHSCRSVFRHSIANANDNPDTSDVGFRFFMSASQ